MIKKKIVYINNVGLILFMSCLKKNKIKKNILLKNFFKINTLKKYKKYKLLNLNIIQQKKSTYINIYKKFYDLLIWALFIFSNRKLKSYFNVKNLKYKKKKIFKNIKFKRIKNKSKKKKKK